MTHGSEKIIHQAVLSVIECLDLKIPELVNSMKASAGTIRRCSNDFSKLPVSNLYNFSDFYKLDFENLTKNNFDCRTLKEHFSGNLDAIPERYCVYKSSKFRTISNALDVLRPSNSYFVENLKRKLQITDKVLSNSDKKVSGLILQDIFKEMRKFGYPEKSYEVIGAECSRKYKHILLKNLTGKITRSNLYSKIFDSIEMNIEKNLFYKVVKVNSKETIISATTREEAKDSFKVNYFGEPEHYLNIKGWLSGINEYFFNQKANVTMLSSLVDGDQHQYYRIEHSQKYYH